MGFFIHPKEGEGFNQVRADNGVSCFFFVKPMYEFWLNPKTPLMYVDNKGQTWQPDLHFKNDLGSTPPCLQRFFPKDEFLASYSFHDSACKYGYLWMKSVVHAPFQKEYMTLFQSNKLLEEMIEAEAKLSEKKYKWKWLTAIKRKQEKCHRNCIRFAVDVWAFWKYATRRIRK